MPETLLANNGRPLRCCHWHPRGPIRARVILLHGIESHVRWFEGTCRWLAKLGFHVAALERRGSGTDVPLDSPDRGDIDSYRTWLEDVNVLGESLRNERPQTKIHLLGISWGGKLACACAAAPTPDASWLSSLVLISPGLEPRVDVSFATKLGVAWSYLSCPQRRFALPIGRPEMFTASERWKEFIQGDALRLQAVTARFLVQNVKLDRFLRKHQAQIRVPILLLLAQQDDIIDVKKTKTRIAALGSGAKKILEYPGAVHTLEFEDNPDLWRKDVLAWLDSF